MRTEEAILLKVEKNQTDKRESDDSVYGYTLGQETTSRGLL